MTFQSQTLTKYIRVGYYRMAVSQFIPNPVRCYKCQKLATQNLTAEKMKFAINVGKRITLPLRNVKMKQNVSTAKEIMHQMKNHVQNEKKKRIFKR